VLGLGSLSYVMALVLVHQFQKKRKSLKLVQDAVFLEETMFYANATVLLTVLCAHVLERLVQLSFIEKELKP
jgi:hypothetical protein